MGKTQFVSDVSKLFENQGIHLADVFMYGNYTRVKSVVVEKDFDKCVLIAFNGSSEYPLTYDCNALFLFNSKGKLLDHVEYASLSQCKINTNLLSDLEKNGLDVVIHFEDIKQCAGSTVLKYDNVLYEKMKDVASFSKLIITEEGFQLVYQ